MLLEGLEQGKGIPVGTKRENVAQLMNFLLMLLTKKLQEKYIWLAVCTVAVDAGCRGGDKRRKRRMKIRSMIQECANYIGIPDPTSNLPKGWENTGLYYGYGATAKWQEDTKINMDTALFFGFFAPIIEGKRIDQI